MTAVNYTTPETRPQIEVWFLTRQPHISAKSGGHVVFTVKGIDPGGRTMVFACGTDEQAVEKTWELRRRGFRDVVVVDHKGKELGDAAFERSLEIDWD